MRFVVALLLLVSISSAFAAGPDVIAYSDRSLWPDRIDSRASFDRASRAEILAFASTLNAVADQDADTLEKLLDIKYVSTDSVQSVKKRLMAQLYKNWQAASASCTSKSLFCPHVDTPEKFLEASMAFPGTLPDAYRKWYGNAKTFDARYAGELVRLAALFPKVSSEIDTYSPIEHTGLELPDRQFLLTFDDGPTPKKGDTDLLLPILAKNKLHASFYMLGSELQARLKRGHVAEFTSMYKGQCTSLHGWKHYSHARWSKWQQSILDTQALVKQTFPGEYHPWFRPPYGQRRADSAAFFNKNGLKVALWNIDSQDWNTHVSGMQAAQRVYTLMLIWRRGVILFHDVHPKAQVAVPWLLDHTNNTGIIWMDCHNYN